MKLIILFVMMILFVSTFFMLATLDSLSRQNVACSVEECDVQKFTASISTGIVFVISFVFMDVMGLFMLFKSMGLSG